MNNGSRLLVASLAAMLSIAGSARGDLIAYYTFDTDATATEGTDATLAANASISTTMSAVGGGSLMLGVPSTDAVSPLSDGATSGNSFAWATDTRSVAFWMMADTSLTPDTNPTMLSLGAGTGAGNRFDVRVTGGLLRLEIQGGGTTTAVDVGDGNWYFVALTLEDPATVANSQYYVYDSGANLVGSGLFGGSGTEVATGDGPLRMGDSYQDTGRDFYGYLDDVRLYDNALTGGEVLTLAQMSNAVPEPSTFALVGLGLAGLAILRKRKV